MPQSGPLLIDMPAELAAEAVRDLGGRRVLRSVRGGTVENVALVLGIGGSLVSLIQTPTTIRDFATWLVKTATRRGETTIVRVAKSASGNVTVEVQPEMVDPDTVAELLKQAMRAD